MALVDPSSSRCAICDGLLDRPYIATWGVPFALDDARWRDADAPLHLDCLETWPLRRSYARGYAARSLVAHRRGYGTLLHRARGWHLGCGPRAGDTIFTAAQANPREPWYVEVRLHNWPIRLYSRWRDWDDFASGGFREGLTGAALEAAVVTMDEVRQVAPSGGKLAELLDRIQPR